MSIRTFYFDLDDLLGVRLELQPGTECGKIPDLDLYEHYLNLCRIAEHVLTHLIDDIRHGRAPTRFLDLPERVKPTPDIDWDNVDFRNPKFPGTEKCTDKDEETKNMNTKRAVKLLQIAHYYGEEKQVCKLMEELGEATSAASEVLMLLSYHEQGGKKRDLTARLEHLAGELADVVNVTEQIIQLFGLETDFKVARHAGIQKTLKRIREEEQANETRDELARRNLQ